MLLRSRQAPIYPTPHLPPYTTVTAPRLLRPKVDSALSASPERVHPIRIDAVHMSVCSVSCHLAVVTRSPFFGRFAACEISCVQISIQQTALLERGVQTLWRLTCCWVRCRHEPNAQSWPRSYIRWSRSVNRIFTAVKLLRGVGAGGAGTGSTHSKGSAQS